MKLYAILDDGTIIDGDLKITHWGQKRFIDTILDNNNCFLCGDNSKTKPFNEEHILPDWVLSKYKLYSSQITLPNLSHYTYAKYKIPCCVECNSFLGENIENKISKIISKGYSYTAKYLKSKGPKLFFIWIALIYFKTHYKDNSLNISQDTRIDFGKIGDKYNWLDLHHIHCILHSLLTDSSIENNNIGSMFIFPLIKSNPLDKFDYLDFYICQTVYIQLGNIGIICVLNDSCFVNTVLSEQIKKINGLLSPIQARELAIKYAHANASLRYRPKYYTELNTHTGKVILNAKLPKSIIMKKFNRKMYGKMMYQYLNEMLSSAGNKDIEYQLSQLRKGNLTFLFNHDGSFNKMSMVLKRTT